MRKIGAIADKISATALNDCLYAKGIAGEVRTQDNGWAVWIYSDDKLDEAKLLMERFLENPGAAEHANAAKAGKAKRLKEEAERKKERSKTINMRRRWEKASRASLGRLTLALIIISTIITLLSNFGDNQRIKHLLLISTYYFDINFPFLIEIRNGQIWRLFTPMFLHFGIMHLVFNMLWLRDLGGMIEALEGPWSLGVKVAVIQIISALVQYSLVSPLFGGMSGVVYGLFGYIWMKRKYDPLSGCQLHQSTVTMMLIWFALCFTPIIPNVANGVHAAGLAVGASWGWLSSGGLGRALKRL